MFPRHVGGGDVLICYAVVCDVMWLAAKDDV